MKITQTVHPPSLRDGGMYDWHENKLIMKNEHCVCGMKIIMDRVSIFTVSNDNKDQYNRSLNTSRGHENIVSCRMKK